MSDTAPLEAVAKAVHDLSESVIEMRAGQIDAVNVERIATEVLDRQRVADVAANEKKSYTPPDEQQTDETISKRFRGPDRLDQILQRSAGRVAQAIKRDEADVLEFQRRSDALMILSAARGVDPRETDYYKEEFLPSVRAMDETTTAEGTEYVPRELSANLIERVNLQLRVSALFPSIIMPTPTFDIPARAVSRQRMGTATEQTADTGQTKFKAVTPATRKVTLTAVKFAGEMITSKELEEDSIIAIMPLMQQELVDYMSADIEDATINGDTTGTHQDSDVTGADDPRKIWKGLRISAISGAKTDASSASLLTVPMLRTNRKVMGKYGIIPTDLAHILSMSSYIQLLADASVITMEKFGPYATILTGELGKADGVPIIVSEYVRTDLNASGVFDNSTKTETVALTVHRNGFINGERRGMTIQVLRELYAESDQDAIIASSRRAFAARFTATTEPIVAVTYNVDS